MRGCPHALGRRTLLGSHKVLSPIGPTVRKPSYADTSIGFKLSIMIAYQPTFMVAVLRRANEPRQSTRLVACNCLGQGKKQGTH